MKGAYYIYFNLFQKFELINEKGRLETCGAKTRDMWDSIFMTAYVQGSNNPNLMQEPFNFLRFSKANTLHALSLKSVDDQIIRFLLYSMRINFRTIIYI
jgi:hypothetical protein